MDAPAELHSERTTLEKADRDIAEGEERIRNQENLIAELRTEGQDTREAERLLRLLDETLTHWRDHRVLILQRIAHLEREADRQRI